MLKLNIKIKQTLSLHSKSVTTMFRMWKIKNPELVNLGTPFVLLIITFIYSYNFSVEYWSHSTKWLKIHQPSRWYVDCSFPSLFDDFGRLRSISPIHYVRYQTINVLANLLMSMDCPARTLGKLKVHSVTFE